MTPAPHPLLPATGVNWWRRGASTVAVGAVAAAIPALVATAYASAGCGSRASGSNLRPLNLVCTEVIAERKLVSFIRLTRSAGRIWGDR